MPSKEQQAYDYAGIVAGLNQFLKLRTTVIGMKLFETVEEMEAIPRIRRPKDSVHTTDQIVAQATRLNFTVGITAEDLVGAQCGAVIGLWPQDRPVEAAARTWRASGSKREADAAEHQAAMDVVPHGKYAGRWRSRRWQPGGSTRRTSA